MSDSDTQRSWLDILGQPVRHWTIYYEYFRYYGIYFLGYLDFNDIRRNKLREFFDEHIFFEVNFLWWPKWWNNLKLLLKNLSYTKSISLSILLMYVWSFAKLSDITKTYVELVLSATCFSRIFRDVFSRGFSDLKSILFFQLFFPRI